MRYMSKPQVVEAIQWTGDNIGSLVEFLRPAYNIHPGVILLKYREDKNSVELLAGKNGAQGWVPVPVGHYIVHNPNDYTDLWPIEPDYFENKYDRVTHYADEE